MSPLTTPYSGRVVGGGMDVVRTSSPALGPNRPGKRGLNAFTRGSMTPSPQNGYFPYFRYAQRRFVGLGACVAAVMVTRSADGWA